MSDDYNTAAGANLAGPPATAALPLVAALESLLFVADGPVLVAQFAEALEASPRAIETALEELELIYQHRGLRIQRDKSGIQLTTAPQAAEAVERFLGLESLQRLSRPAVETLAIIAYQQPVTRPYIESIRGVNCDGVIKSLWTKGLIEEVGRTEGPGRPVLYATTSAFLQHFGLASLTDLPPLDIESLLAAARVAEPPGALPDLSQGEAPGSPQPSVDRQNAVVGAVAFVSPVAGSIFTSPAAKTAPRTGEVPGSTALETSVDAQAPASVRNASAGPDVQPGLAGTMAATEPGGEAADEEAEDDAG